MAKKPVQKAESTSALQVVLGGVIVALLVLLIAVFVRAPLHPPYYDTISATAEGQSAP